jgi:hypothetical protein
MKFWTSRFQNGLRRLKSHVNSLWRGLIPRRPDDAAEPGDLDRLWRAECDEMDATLVAVIPLENESLWAVPTPRSMFDAKGGEPTLAASQHFFLRRNKADLGRCEITPVLDYHHSASQPFRVQ